MLKQTGFQYLPCSIIVSHFVENVKYHAVILSFLRHSCSKIRFESSKGRGRALSYSIRGSYNKKYINEG